ncbi:Multi antimicrobial extrusion protein [Dillenia turbinata]|uniref:Protein DETOXIFICATION n=1 Tax=Dillenia turbinata TaxID=194707 RepID=A0AAN8ZR28_9MAGN
MAVTQLSCGCGCQTGSRGFLKNPGIRQFNRTNSVLRLTNSDVDVRPRRLLSANFKELLPLSAVCRRRRGFSVSDGSHGQFSSDLGLVSSDLEETLLEDDNNNDVSVSQDRISASTWFPASQSGLQSVKRELINLSLPAVAGQALEPLTQLLETAFIGRFGAVELASAGVSMSIFNIISKLFNIPLLSVATSFVAEEIAKSSVIDLVTGDVSVNWNPSSPASCCSLIDFQEERTNGKPLGGMAERKQLASVSTALFLAFGIGMAEALAMFLGSGFFLNLMGIPLGSAMRVLAQQFLCLRALGAPAFVVSLALQGVFRGLGNFAAVILFPVLINYFHLGVTGAAIATVISQYTVTILMIWQLNKRAVLLPPNLGALQFGGYLKSGGFLIGRTLAVLITMTLGTSMAARQGPVAMAAHQICLQVWLAVSLLTDALAASGQALIASSLSRGDYVTVREITYFILKLGLLTGISLAAILGASFGGLATFFTKDMRVLEIVRSGVWFVSLSQPFNSLAFVFDGLHYGVSDFPYAACSMMLVGAISSAFLLYAPSILGLRGVWLGLTLLMGLRAAAGITRLAVKLLSKNGPWWFLYEDFKKTECLHAITFHDLLDGAGDKRTNSIAGN